MDGQGTTWRTNIAENFNRLSSVYERYRQTTDGRTTTYSKANKTYNFNVISLTTPGNQKGKCPSCWPPIAQTKVIVSETCKEKNKNKNKEINKTLPRQTQLEVCVRRYRATFKRLKLVVGAEADSVVDIVRLERNAEKVSVGYFLCTSGHHLISAQRRHLAVDDIDVEV